jgi:dihydrofolate reductase
MNLELIVASTIDGIIGFNNKIPWYIPEDLKYFKNITYNSVVIMGRKTFESLPNGPLKNRINIILSKNISNTDNENTDNVFFINFKNIDDICKILDKYTNKRVFVIGGNEIYKLLYDYCKIVHITIIYEKIEGDTIFPYSLDYMIKTYKRVSEYDLLYSKNNNLKFKYYTFEKSI